MANLLVHHPTALPADLSFHGPGAAMPFDQRAAPLSAVEQTRGSAPSSRRAPRRLSLERGGAHWLGPRARESMQTTGGRVL